MVNCYWMLSVDLLKSGFAVNRIMFTTQCKQSGQLDTDIRLLHTEHCSHLGTNKCRHSGYRQFVLVDAERNTGQIAGHSG